MHSNSASELGKSLDFSPSPILEDLSASYPVSESFKVVEGFDIYRSDNLIIALVVVESDRGKDLRMYRWQKRKDQWKVDLCRMSVTRWNWSKIAETANSLVEKHQMARSGSRLQPET